MKRYLALFLCMLSICLLCGGTYNTKAPEGSAQPASLRDLGFIAAPDHATVENTPYQVLPQSSEWKELHTTSEMLHALQLPQEMLTEMKTEEVLFAVLTFPLLGNIYACNSSDPQDALQMLSNQSDAYQELLNRSDAKEKLQAVYDSYVEENRPSLDIKTIEIILSDQRLK